MLHEILLSLSGQQSSLFNLQTEEDAVFEESFPLLSPPEKALLASLARLSRLHARLRAHTALICSSHPSVICRAVSTAIRSHHLGAFQKKILDVEKAILVEDSGYVGGYGIVPLATVVGEFAPWTRRLEWLWGVVRFIQPNTKKEHTQNCTGAGLINHLRGESQTGYVDIEEIVLHLIGAAETAWMRQLSTWLLYGNLPILGKGDFFIQEAGTTENDGSAAQFAIHTRLIPQFVSSHTAASILFIGKTLNLIRAKRGPSGHTSDTLLLTSPVTLHGEHISHLAGLKSPISASKLSNAVDSIRISLSQSTLSKLLPLPKLLEILSLLHDFLLLQRGEFATALVSHANARLRERQLKPESSGARDLLNSVDGLAIKEGDVATTLSNTWAELYSLQNEEDPVDDELDLARELVRLSLNSKVSSQSLGSSPGDATAEPVAETSSVSFDDLLFPISTSLSVQVRPPLDLFLSAADVSIYSKMHSYLLGIRRAQIRLGDLWKHTPLRRSHPSPWGPPRSNSRFGRSRLQMGRQRENTRTGQMRAIWATSSASLFVLSEIGTYFQGEVINGSWQHFRDWIEAGVSNTASPSGSRPGTATSSKARNIRLGDQTEDGPDVHPRRHDPEALTVAHRRYLFSLVQLLFINDAPFTAALRGLLAKIDHFIALVIRLESIQRNMDLESDEGVVDALVDYASEEREVWHALGAARGDTEKGINEVIARLRDIDDSRAEEGRMMFEPSTNATSHSNSCSFRPRKAAGVDRLLMKLDFGTAGN
ncbi:putative gamma-tubulin complex component GCP4 [Aspergillus mulundensis]|uniref:Spindle pole body component n=1 Tax=Aspergillus mulundensis TaxID=1810919 RepID=A0A3D8RX60_9EURO|nr:Spindle pole body component [Aspergillus mulundensis]RDW78652.1 Spindle pole body component [Aspergillus mulundensis]